MELKSFWINAQKLTTKQVDTTTLSVGETELVKAKVIRCDPKTGILIFSAYQTHHRARVTRGLQKNTLLIYLFTTQQEILVHLAPPHKEKTITTFQDKIRSPLAGRVVCRLVAVGEKIEKNQPLVIIESMKMENELCATSASIVKTIPIKQNDLVESGNVMITLSKRD